MRVHVLGRGLAGAWMAHWCAERGVEVTIVDPFPQLNASRVAAGLINPTTGTRPKSTWRSEVLLPFAHEAYRQAELKYQATFWTPRTIRRLFLTQKDADLWAAAVERGPGVEWQPLAPGHYDGVHYPFGGVAYQGATVDTNAFIDAVSAHNDTTTASPMDVDLTVWATGWQASHHDLWSWLPFQPVKGEILDVVHEGEPLSAVVIRGIWIIPGPRDHRQQVLRIGSTHDWDDLTNTPTATARETLLAKAEEILHRPLTVVGQQAAVRPAAQSKRPFVGIHPEHRQHAILNGLGAKGSLWAPWAATQLLDHVMYGAPIDAEVDIQRWWQA